MSAPGPARAATEADLDRLCELMRENYAEAGYAYDAASARACFAALLDPGLGATWVLEAADEVVGYVVLALGTSLEWGGRDAFVDDLYVSPAHRGAGLGRLAMDLVEVEARRRGVVALHLEVERSNQRAEALYRRLGYRDQDRRLMTKPLLRPGGAA